jgi:chorismate synthase
MLTRLRMLTAGESHGPALVGILEGLPCGLPIARDAIATDLRRRRVVAGRSARQQIENDDVRVLSGLRGGVTLGSPVALVLENQDHARWTSTMSIWPMDAQSKPAAVTVPRPGHADLAGQMKLDTRDLRDVIERASARETAMRTALGALARALLAQVGVRVTSYVEQIGGERAPPVSLAFDALASQADASPVRAIDASADARMQEAIAAARRAGDTLGGSFVVVAEGMPGGVGSFAQADLRLSARLCEAVASIHGVKAAGVGDAWRIAEVPGRAAHDEIALQDGALVRPTNRAGGVEGGITNGAPVIVRGVQKPLATLAGGLPSVDLQTRQPASGHVERTDTCAVPAAAVVAEAMVALVLADALLVTFGGDTLQELRARVNERRQRTA